MISFLAGGHRFHFRSAVIIRRGEAVLLHRAEGDDFWALPGGRVEAGESAQAAAVREIREELDTGITANELALVVENFFDYHGEKHHELGLYFHARPDPDSLLQSSPGPYEGREEKKRLEFAWFLPQELASLEIRPTFLKELLVDATPSFRHIVWQDPNRPQ